MRIRRQQQLQVYQQKSDELAIRLEQAINRELIRFKLMPDKLAKELQHCDPSKIILEHQNKREQLDERLKRSLQLLVTSKTEHFVNIIEQLNIVSPLATIARGYSVSRNSSNEIVRTKDQVSIGDKLSIQVNDGSIYTEVTGKV